MRSSCWSSKRRRGRGWRRKGIQGRTMIFDEAIWSGSDSSRRSRATSSTAQSRPYRIQARSEVPVQAKGIVSARSRPPPSPSPHSGPAACPSVHSGRVRRALRAKRKSWRFDRDSEGILAGASADSTVPSLRGLPSSVSERVRFRLGRRIRSLDSDLLADSGAKGESGAQSESLHLPSDAEREKLRSRISQRRQSRVSSRFSWLCSIVDTLRDSLVRNCSKK